MPGKRKKYIVRFKGRVMFRSSCKQKAYLELVTLRMTYGVETTLHIRDRYGKETDVVV